MLAVAISKGWRELFPSMWRKILQTSIIRASVSPATWSCRDLPRRGLHMNTLWRYSSGYHMMLRSAESVHKLVVQLLYTFLHRFANILRHWTDHRSQRRRQRAEVDQRDLVLWQQYSICKALLQNNWRKLYLQHGELCSGSLSTVLQCVRQAPGVGLW